MKAVFRFHPVTFAIGRCKFVGVPKASITVKCKCQAFTHICNVTIARGFVATSSGGRAGSDGSAGSLCDRWCVSTRLKAHCVLQYCFFAVKRVFLRRVISEISGSGREVTATSRCTIAAEAAPFINLCHPCKVWTKSGTAFTEK